MFCNKSTMDGLWDCGDMVVANFLTTTIIIFKKAKGKGKVSTRYYIGPVIVLFI